MQLIKLGRISKGLGIVEGLGQANPCDADILGQMRRKFVSSGSGGPALDDRPPGTTVQLDEKV